MQQSADEKAIKIIKAIQKDKRILNICNVNCCKRYYNEKYDLLNITKNYFQIKNAVSHLRWAQLKRVQYLFHLVFSLQQMLINTITSTYVVIPLHVPSCKRSCNIVILQYYIYIV